VLIETDVLGMPHWVFNSGVAGPLTAWCGGQICRPIVLGFGMSNRTQSKTQ